MGMLLSRALRPADGEALPVERWFGAYPTAPPSPAPLLPIAADPLAADPLAVARRRSARRSSRRRRPRRRSCSPPKPFAAAATPAAAGLAATGRAAATLAAAATGLAATGLAAAGLAAAGLSRRLCCHRPSDLTPAKAPTLCLAFAFAHGFACFACSLLVLLLAVPRGVQHEEGDGRARRFVRDVRDRRTDVNSSGHPVHGPGPHRLRIR